MTYPIGAKGGREETRKGHAREKNARNKGVAKFRVRDKGGQKKNSHGAARGSRRWI